MDVVDNMNNNKEHSWKSDIRFDPMVNWNVYEERSDTDMEQSDDTSASDCNTPRCCSPTFGYHDSSSDSETETESSCKEPEKRRVRRRRRASFDEKLMRKTQISILPLESNVNRRMAKTSPGTPIEHNSLKNFHAENLSSALFLGSILCADRVTQMTRTYNDIEALTRMLEEKERDLELAARIGQTLLEKNKDLTERSDTLEDHLASANDKVSQLRHDISMKDELLKFYCQETDNETESDASSPGDGKGFNLKLVNIEALQKKVVGLEDENLQLKLESSQLKTETSNYEEKEKKLVEDCLSQLAEVNMQVETFADELSRKTEESSRQKEEITALLAQVVDLQKRVRCLTIENMELSKHLQASQESQRKLTTELGYRQDKYDELLEVLADAQDELKTLRGKHRPGSTSRQYLSSSLLNVPSDSLACELESSLRSDLDYPKGYSPSERKAHNWKIFETAKAAKKASKKSSDSNSPGSASLNASGAESDSASYSKRASFYFSDTESADGYSADLDSLHGSNPDLGRPGIPGSNDLETSLKRLAMRRANELNEKDFFRDEDEKKKQQHLSVTPRTPDSLPSPGSGHSYLSFPGSQHSYFKIPEKLQIVKPMEGSATLRQWQQLATPNLEGIFEERPGVQIKGERNLDIQEEMYRLSDFEEDDDISDCPSKSYDETASIYTLTDSLVRNPVDPNIMVSPPSSDTLHQAGSMPTNSTPLMSTPKSRMASMKGSNTTTYSMSLGLAAILNERDSATQVERKPGLKYNQSYPSRLQSVVTEIPFCSTKTHTSNVATTSAPSTRRSSIVVTPSPSTASTPTEGGILGKLKNTGFSIYGFLGGVKSEESDSSSSDASHVASVPASTASPTTNPSAEVEGATASSPNSEKTLTRTLITQGASAGVLGALTSFRRSGIL